MAIDIKAPLADRLFALGSTVGADNPTFKYKGGQGGSYSGQAPLMGPAPASNGDGRAKGLASIAGALASAYSQNGAPAATNANGNGFGLGGNLVSGAAGNADYAGQRGLFSFGAETQNAGQNGLFNGFTYGSNY